MRIARSAAVCISVALSVASPARATDSAQVFSPGVISDKFDQWRIAFDADGDIAYFAESEGFFPITRRASIYLSRRTGESWSEPELAPFSGRYPDIDPAFSADGKRLYFSSIRTPRGDVDLWYVQRQGEGWGEPVRLGDEVNSPDDELYPSIGPDGTLYFASGPAAPAAGRHYDIYEARADGDSFAPRVALSEAINTLPAPEGGLQDAWEFNPEISSDGKLLVFCSLRKGGYGKGDLYASTLEDGKWSPAVNLGPAVNTEADEYHPTLSGDRERLFFARRVPDTGGDFFQVPTRLLKYD